MKIVYFIDHLRPDGTQQVLRQLVDGLAARGHQQAVVCLNDSADPVVVQSLHASGAQLRTIGKRGLIAVYGLISTWGWLRREQFDVAITLLFAADVLGRVLARSAGVGRIVSSVRARNTNYSPWQRWMVRKTMRWVDTVILNSAIVRDFAIAVEGAPPERTFVIPNGVTIHAYHEPVTRAALRGEFGLSADACLIGAVGRLTRQKGFDLLVEALALIRRPDVHVLLMGQGEEEAALRTQAAKLGITERLHFAGYRRDVLRLLSALDVYVHPARFEGMPNALLEAMVAGCSIVATAVDGNRELIEDGVHGWLVAPEDATGIAVAIECVLANGLEARRRAMAAQQRAVTGFTVDAMVEAWEKALTDRN